MKSKLESLTIMIYLILFFCIAAPTLSASELDQVEEAIALTKRQLEKELALQKLLTEYLDQQKIFMTSSDPKKEAKTMVSLAFELSLFLKKEHLDHLLSPTLLEEVLKFAQIGGSYKTQDSSFLGSFEPSF